MSETKVHFEHLGQGDRIDGIAKLLLRRGRLTPHVFILCPDEGFMAQLDERLWTVHPESFLAHAVVAPDREVNAMQPILLGLKVCRDNEPAVLVNGGLEVPPDLEGFSHIVDFVDGWEERLLAASRERFRTYRQMGLEPTYIGKSDD